MATMAVALATVVAGIGAPTAAPAASPKACLIVDTDVGLDDYRAFAVLAPARDLRAVVVTEGISAVPRRRDRRVDVPRRPAVTRRRYCPGSPRRPRPRTTGCRRSATARNG